MRTVVRNSFARHTIRAERVHVQTLRDGCANCGNTRGERFRASGMPSHLWLYRFHVDDDSGSRYSGPIADGRLFCSRDCAESFIDQPFDETKGH